MKPLGKISVKKAVEEIYPQLPHRFSMSLLHVMVAREIRRPRVYMDTCRRKAMELRQKGVISFKNIDRAKSLYRKND